MGASHAMKSVDTAVLVRIIATNPLLPSLFLSLAGADHRSEPGTYTSDAKDVTLSTMIAAFYLQNYQCRYM